MKVLIISGVGLIGHNTALYLKDRSLDVVAFDSLKRSYGNHHKLPANNWNPYNKGRCPKYYALKKVLANVDMVVHAAYISVEESIKKPPYT